MAVVSGVAGKERAHIIRWMCDVSMKDRRTSEELIKLVGVRSDEMVCAYDEEK